MRILVETSGGGGVVLLVALALLASHGGGISAALAAVVIALVVAVVLAVAGLGAYLVYRARREVRPHFRQVVAPGALGARPSSALPAGAAPALEQPAVRLHRRPSSPRSSAARRSSNPGERAQAHARRRTPP